MLWKNAVSLEGFSLSWAGSAGRPLIAGWCILGIVLTSCYTSKLTSLLVGVTPVPPFTSVAEMLAQDEYRWGVKGGSKLPQVLRVSGMLSRRKKRGTDDEKKTFQTSTSQPTNHAPQKCSISKNLSSFVFPLSPYLHLLFLGKYKPTNQPTDHPTPLSLPVPVYLFLS